MASCFTRKPSKHEGFIRPRGLFPLHNLTQSHLLSPILVIKTNPSSPGNTTLRITTKGSLMDVNVKELALVTQGGKIIWGEDAQVGNNPENDGCINNSDWFANTFTQKHLLIIEAYTTISTTTSDHCCAVFECCHAALHILRQGENFF